MKILVIQLARLGDIYQTWPVLAALRRVHPNAQIDLLTRCKFAGAAEGLSAVDHVWRLDTIEVLAPLIDERPAIHQSIEKLDAFCAEIKANGYDRIANLSFSPFSSYLTQQLAGPETQILGYTRFEDGYLRIPDDGSAYVYGQVGVGRANRLHLTDLFAHIVGVELEEEDWKTCLQHQPCDPGDDFLVVHVGASHSGKTLSWSKWLQVCKGLMSKWPGQIVLVGAAEERELGEQVAAISGDRRPVNLVGETSLMELREIVREARLLIAGDSGPMQLATLVNTPVLNISFPMVSFWETGPRAKGSRIFPVDSNETVSAEEIVDEALSMLAGRFTQRAVIRVLGRNLPYVEMRPQPRAFEWNLLRALYMGGEFPPAPSELFLAGIQRLSEVNLLAREQIATLRTNHRNQMASSILDQVDEIMEQIMRMVPETGVIVRWFRTERIRIGPMSVERLIEATDETHDRLGAILSLYLTAPRTDDDVQTHEKPTESNLSGTGSADGDLS